MRRRGSSLWLSMECIGIGDDAKNTLLGHVVLEYCLLVDKQL